jgi:hypothetical protein
LQFKSSLSVDDRDDCVA